MYERKDYRRWQGADDSSWTSLMDVIGGGLRMLIGFGVFALLANGVELLCRLIWA